MIDFHPGNPHDHFFRRTFDVLENARALLKSQLPAHLFKKLDPNSIQPAKETFLAADEYENRLDQLYTARMLNGTQVWIYLLLEHKSWVDRRIALQLLKYVLRIHEWLDRNGRPPQVVIPLVVYHGEKVWDEPTSLRDKIDAAEDLLDFVPDMRAILVDLSQLKSAFLPNFPELEARIRALQIARSKELSAQSLVEIFKLLPYWEKIHSQMDALNDIMIYLCSVLDSQNLELLEFAFQAGQLPQSEKKMPNCLEALLERGRNQGLERGLLIGRIRTLQQVLAQPAMTSQDSLLLSLEELQTLAAKLESQLNLD
jgi:predicted transposase YdaD